MQKLNIYFGKLLWGLLTVLLLSSISSTLRAEGTKQVAPNPPSDFKPPVMLIIENDRYGDFGTQDGSRLYFTIAESGETIHLGLSEPYNDDGNVINGSYFVRIYRDGTSTPVSTFEITNNSSGTNANVLDYDDAEFGFYIDDFNYTAAEAGDYYIEFELKTVSPNVSKEFYIGFWDFTVTGDAGTEIPGRVWSRNWAFRTPSIVPIPDTPEDQAACGWNRPFDGVLYSYTDDNNTNGFVTKIDFAESGFLGLSFNVAFNSRGPGDESDLSLARQSRSGNLTTSTGEYRVFLNEPDPNVFVSDDSLCGNIEAGDLLGCPSDNSYCIDVTVTQAGQVEVILDFDDDGILTPDSRDTSYIYTFAEADTRCLEFPGLYSNGDPIEFGDKFTLVFTYIQGVQHYAAFDVEYLTNGFCVETIRPICNPDPTSFLNQATRFLYWDDQNISDDPVIGWDGLNPPKDGRSGYLCDGGVLRRWDNFSLGGQECIDNDGKVANDSQTEGYGDKNTLNTWWFANFDTATVSNLVLLDCMIGGADDICDATLFAEVVGGSPPYTFSWSGPGSFTATDSLVTVTLAGEYSVTVTDATGCTTTCNTTLADLSGISCEVEGPDMICMGDMATYTVTALGGTPPFSYSWTGPGDLMSTEQSITVSEAGEYCATVMDAAGCETICCRTLSFFSDLSCTVDGPAMICIGDTATYTAVAIGGTAPLSYSWTGPANFTSSDESIEITEAGEYCATITDANGCTTECCQTLSFFADFSCTVDGPTTICVGDTATYTVLLTGGTAPFSYSWTGPANFTSSDESIEATEAGEYCATITDANGCETECCQTLSFISEISCTVEGPDMICVGDSATYTATATAGAEPFTYNWTGPGDFMSTEQSIIVSEAGEYCATVTDANGCETECCRTLSFFPDLSCTVDGPAMICVGDTATYTATVTGGAAPFSYSWTGPGSFISSDESVEVTEAGEYCATITDANGCTTECCQTLSFFADLSCTVDGPSTICVGDTATYTAIVTGGTAPFSYSWTGPANFTSSDESIEATEAGEYCATITDANGCETECCQTLSFVTEISCAVDGPDMICVGETATYTATATAGAEPFTYNWTGPGGFMSNEQSITVSEAGEYCATVTDANGCETECCKTLSFFPDLSCTVDGPAMICVGDTATYTATVTGGADPFSYDWTGPGGFSSTEASVLVTEAGEYCATVTDANGCTTECCQTLSFFADLSCTVDGPSTICVGDTATYTAIVTGGTAPFSYSWTGPGGFISTDESIEAFEAGEYCATITDANGCETECCQTLSFVTEISCTVEGPDMICVGETATYTATATAGAEPFTYNWTGPGDFMSNEQSITVSEAGEYCATVTDANGCETECCKTLSFFPDLSCMVDGPAMICVGDTATYTATVTGGADPFSYDWTGPGGFSSTEAIVLVTEAGEYCATITDANGCTTECCQTLSFFADLSCTVDGPSTICLGDTATYTAIVTGGTAPFSYSWTGPGNFMSTDESIEAFEAGEYCATITDANGCETECCQTLSFITEISCTVEGPDMICVGETATYTATATAGSEPFTYSWTGPGGFMSTEQSITVSEAGEYCATVTDAGGCETECCKTLSFFPDLSCMVDGPAMICVGDTATYTATVMGGVAPFSYDWTGPGGFSSTEASVLVTEAGEYCATVTDANGCTTECCQTLSFFADLSCTVEGPATICVGDTATYTATVTGGTGPFSYSWTGPGNFMSTEESIEATEAGEYCATVTDANGCTTECCQTLSFVSEISCTVEGPDMICVGETATYTATATAGAEPFTYSWTGPGNFMSTEQSITVSEAGEYCATVTDANGCETECCRTLSFFEELSCEIEGPDDPICLGDTANFTANVTGGTGPFTFSWTGPNNFTAAEASVTVSDAGVYTATVTDANGCTTECSRTLDVINVTVDLTPDQTEVIIGGSVTLTADAMGCTNCTYVWTGPNGPINEDGPVISVTPDLPLQPNNQYTYTVTVSENGLCPAQASVTIIVTTFCDPEHIYLPNAFTPNGDMLNDELGVLSNSLELFQDMELLIYNRWGEEMFRTTNPTDTWDGRYRGEPLPPDVYGFYLRVVCPSGEELIQKGNITLLR